jgi:NADPH-dependent 2,4-dienoyl-CoA reductase/sulfur reductase-like enzyme
MGKRFVIVGNGVAGVTAAMTLRDRDDRADITLLSAESEYFFSRTALMYAFMNTLERRDMEPFERKVYGERRIRRVLGRVVDLDADARALTLQSGEALAYDALLLATGSVPRRLDAPGLTPDLAGLVHFVSMQDLDACERFTPTTREAVVVGGGLIGIELVECLAHHGVRTTFLVREPWYWPVALCREEGELITAHMRAHGVDVRHGAEVGEVEKDASGRVAAVRTRAGERLACQMLGVCIGVEPGVDFLRRAKTPPALGRGIKTDAQLRTSLANVWAAGDCAEVTIADGRTLVEQIWYSAKRQGALAGRNMSGRAAAYDPPLFFNSAKFFDVEYTTVGDLTNVPAGARALFRKHPTKIITQRVVHHEGRVIGFNMLGSRWDHTVLSRWIEEARPLDWVLEHLKRAQFDVEFGRADLARMTEHDLALETRPHRPTAPTATAGAA